MEDRARREEDRATFSGAAGEKSPKPLKHAAVNVLKWRNCYKGISPWRVYVCTLVLSPSLSSRSLASSLLALSVVVVVGNSVEKARRLHSDR